MLPDCLVVNILHSSGCLLGGTLSKWCCILNAGQNVSLLEEREKHPHRPIPGQPEPWACNKTGVVQVEPAGNTEIAAANGIYLVQHGMVAGFGIENTQHDGHYA